MEVHLSAEKEAQLAEIAVARGRNADVLAQEILGNYLEAEANIIDDQLAAIRAQGWATQEEELAYGLRSVAAPVRGENGTVVAGASLAVQSRDWPAARITRELRPMVLETCAEISQLLGYRGQ